MSKIRNFARKVRREFPYTVAYYIMEMNLVGIDFHENNDVIIKKMTASDTDLLSTEYFVESDHKYKKNILENANPLFEGYMCYNINHNLIGYCWIMRKGSEYHLFKIEKTDAYVAELFVNKEFRGKNYGPKMLKCVCNELKENGANNIKLAVAISNKSAQRCYEKVGFTYQSKLKLLKFHNKVFHKYAL